MQVCQLHGRSDLGLVGVVLLQVASQRSVVAAAVWAVLPPTHRGGAAGAADVDVNVVVDIGGRGGQGAGALGLGRGCDRRRAGKG